MKIFTRSRRDLAAISARIAARSRRDRGAFLAAEISPSRRDHGRDRGEITARYGKSRRPKTRRDLAAILAEMREISAAKNAPRFSPRCGKSRRPKTRRDLAAILAEIAARYGNLGRQIRGEMLQRDRGEIRKSRRPKRAVIARWYRGEIWISRRAVSRRGLGGSLAGICGEKRNSWRSKSYCYPVEKRNSRQPN